MIFRKAEFMISAVKPQQYPEGTRPELAVSGRSNVGKSSLINKLVNRKGLAKVGKTPGKTQTINFLILMMNGILLIYRVMAMQKCLRRPECSGGR